MLDLKRRLHSELMAKKMLSDENIEDELTEVVQGLAGASQDDLEKIGELSYSSLKVSQKVDILHLRKRIENDVTSYYDKDNYFNYILKAYQ